MKLVHDINVTSFKPIITPAEIRERLPISNFAVQVVLESRQIMRDILDGKDKRFFMIIGPCSIHDPKAAIEYARRLLELSKRVQDRIFIVMRTYFEKPRTTVGWKGFINDPYLDNSFQMNEGLLKARKLLLEINELGLSVGTEALEPISPQYLSDLICWTAIGARTTESQSHREMASGLSSPVGFKNNTDGNIQVAVNAIRSAAQPHHFLGMDHDGRMSIVATNGNPYGHLIMRGGGGKPNYDSENVKLAERALEAAGLRQVIVVDCSHDNSTKDFTLQPAVLADCINQNNAGNKSIRGFMIESNLFPGNQPMSTELKYGVSVTDGCVGWDTTVEMVLNAYEKLKF